MHNLHNILVEVLAAQENNDVNAKQKIQEIVNLIENYRNNTVTDGEYKLKLSISKNKLEKEKFANKRFLVETLEKLMVIGSNIKN